MGFSECYRGKGGSQRNVVERGGKPKEKERRDEKEKEDSRRRGRG